MPLNYPVVPDQKPSDTKNRDFSWLYNEFVQTGKKPYLRNSLYFVLGENNDFCGGDEIGEKTYGLGHFFSSLYDHPVVELAFFCLSLVSVEQRQSYLVRLEQLLRSVTKAEIALFKGESDVHSSLL